MILKCSIARLARKLNVDLEGNCFEIMSAVVDFIETYQKITQQEIAVAFVSETNAATEFDPFLGLIEDLNEQVADAAAPVTLKKQGTANPKP